jgi:phosphatidylserine/phosphatidylglycerophosphate/cardiolipin synthase-like enzyme
MLTPSFSTATSTLGEPLSGIIRLNKIVLTRFALWFSLVGLFAPSVATADPKTNKLDYDFDFDFFGSDVFSWADGSRSGAVRGNQGKMALALDSALQNAERYIDFSLYGVDKQDWFFDTLDESLHYGVRVRGVVDQLAGERGEWNPQDFAYRDTVYLYDLLGDTNLVPDVGPDGSPRTGSIMHNKFVVIDRKLLWLGSTNLSHTGIGDEYNANTSIIIRSPEIARLYANEFYQMFSKERFSLYKKPRSSRPILEFADGTRVATFFSPQDSALEQAIIPFIASATKKLDVGIFFLTDERIAHALKQAVKRGVEVRMIFDGLAAGHQSSLHTELQQSGVKVRVENWGGKMHMKTAIADGKHVLMGSMNWSLSGDRVNDENTIVVSNNRSLGGKVGRYFQKLWTTLDDYYSNPNRSRPRAEGWSSINSCNDGLDNDHDGQVDGQDSSCT